MRQFSKAQNNSELNWYRINLTKRKGLEAFRNIIISRVNAINAEPVADKNDDSDEDEDSVYIDSYNRSYLFPSNATDVNGYYDSIMNGIKFSCWVKCTEDELMYMIDELHDNQISAEASRKSNSGSIRIVDESEVGTLRWIIDYAPQNLFRANVVAIETKPATINLPGGTVLAGELSKMRGKVETDKFYFSLLGSKYFIVISKGVANEVVDLSNEIENAKKNKSRDKANNERHWMVLRTSRGSEVRLEQNIERWKNDKKENGDSDVFFETYLPMYVKDIKKNDRIVGQRKALFCPGYLFIHTSISELIRLECDKLWDGTPISRFLVRQSMRKRVDANQALVISETDMTNFMFAVDSNVGNVTLDAGDYVDNEYVKYVNPESPFNQRVGRVLHKGEDLYLTFLPIGLMTVSHSIKIESSQIRKLSKKDKTELNL